MESLSLESNRKRIVKANPLHLTWPQLASECRPNLMKASLRLLAHIITSMGVYLDEVGAFVVVGNVGDMRLRLSPANFGETSHLR